MISIISTSKAVTLCMNPSHILSTIPITHFDSTRWNLQTRMNQPYAPCWRSPSVPHCTPQWCNTMGSWRIGKRCNLERSNPCKLWRMRPRRTGLDLGMLTSGWDTIYNCCVGRTILVHWAPLWKRTGQEDCAGMEKSGRIGILMNFWLRLPDYLHRPMPRNRIWRSEVPLLMKMQLLWQIKW